MKKVVLLGDSIRLIGYGLKVPELLGSDFEVWQPEDNCRYSAYGFRMVIDFKDKIEGADIIHWNNGLWDLIDELGDGPFSSVETYVANMKRIAANLLKLGKKVIFATITPVTAAHYGIKNENVAKYNAAIVPVLKEMGIIINDLNAFVTPNIETFIRKDDNIHLTDEGIDACAKEVADFIKANI